MEKASPGRPKESSQAGKNRKQLPEGKKQQGDVSGDQHEHLVSDADVTDFNSFSQSHFPKAFSMHDGGDNLEEERLRLLEMKAGLDNRGAKEHRAEQH